MIRKLKEYISKPRRTRLWPRVVSSPGLNRYIKNPAGQKAVAGTVVLILILGATALIIAQKKQRESSKDVQVIQVTYKPLDVELVASGTVIALQRVNVSPAKAGRLDRLLIKEGQHVSAGQLLAVMENDEERARLNQIQAELDGALAEEQAERKRLSRFEALRAEGATSEDQVDELKRKVSQASARAAQVRQKLLEAQSVFDKSFIRAPFTGIITRRFAEVAEYVAPDTSASSTAGATSSTIAELSRGLEVQANLPEADLLNIKVGQRVLIKSDAYPDKTFQGKVLRISPRAVVTDNVISFPVAIKLENGLEYLKPQMNVQTTLLPDRSKKVLTVPLAAVITKKEGGTAVFIQTSNGEIKERMVRLGTTLANDVQVTQGIKNGDRVILSAPAR